MKKCILLLTCLLCLCSCTDTPVQQSTVQESSAEPSMEEVSESPVPQDWQDEGLFSEYYEKAYPLGPSLPDLFGRDFEDRSKEEVTENILSYIHSQKIPMTIAVDEEGGDVVRISSKPALYDKEFASPRDIFSEGGMTAIKENAKALAEMLQSFHIDVNFAPVCDISLNEEDFMYYRSIGQDTDTVCEFVREFVRTAQENSVSATLKHFPGYGNNVDTHTGIAIDERAYETFATTDFKPFEAGIAENAHLVMVSHNIVNCMDDTKPASLSPKVHEILRDTLGFTGIVVTDDLEMDAITAYTNGTSPAVAAILAGNDMLTIGDTMLEAAVASVKEAVKDGTLDESLLDHAVMRILAWKYAKRVIL